MDWIGKEFIRGRLRLIPIQDKYREDCLNWFGHMKGQLMDAWLIKLDQSRSIMMWLM